MFWVLVMCWIFVGFVSKIYFVILCFVYNVVVLIVWGLLFFGNMICFFVECVNLVNW